MATSNIKNLVSKSKSDLWLRKAGGAGSDIYNTGAYTIALTEFKLINVNLFNIMTTAQLSTGTSYPIGAIPNKNIDGATYLRVQVDRHDGGHAIGTLKLTNSGTEILMSIEPLETIPSGVGLATNITFFYVDK